jgi:5-methylthioribose kinase
MRVETEDHDLVVKQSRRQLRTEAEWLSRLDRIYREADLMIVLEPLLPPGIVPRVLFEHRDDYLFAMEAVPADHVVWKQELLDGRADLDIAQRMGDVLAAIHRETAGDDELRERFGDRTVFDELRLDPFYRRIAQAHPQIAESIDRLIEETLATSACVVHADFSPKNVLVVRRDEDCRLTLVDYETGHFGDPAFDLGFFLSHLLLKAVLHAGRGDEYLALAEGFLRRYFAGLAPAAEIDALARGELERRTIGHLAACMLARVDGKSPVDYLPHESDRNLVRRHCLDAFDASTSTLQTALDALRDRLRKSSASR